jgi:hypothetical protein
MSEPLDTREEEWTALIDGEFEVIHGGLRQSVVPLEVHKSSLAANREQKAEIDRLKEEYGVLERTMKFMESEYLREHGGSWGECKYQKELASLRASAGEKWVEIKPDTKLTDQMELGRWIRKDKWTITRMEGDAEGWEYTLPNDFFTHYRMLAPPTLPTETEK